MPGLDWLIRPIAHRGLHDRDSGIIENTPSAIQAAIDGGYAIEVDVRETADGEPVVFHDARLERLTEGEGPVKSLTAAQLKRIPFRETADRMQTLEDLSAQVAGRVPLVIEVKSGWRQHGPFEKRIALTLQRYEGQAAVMSFDPESVAAFAACAPALPRGLVSERFRDSAHWGHLPRWWRFRMRHLLTAFIAKPHFIAYDVNALPALAPVAARAVLGWPLLTWTVRTPAQRVLAERWADAMIFEGFRP